MVSFCKCFRPYDAKQELEDINDLLNSIKDYNALDVTFFGKRIVRINEKNVSLNSIADRLLALHKNNQMLKHQEQILENRIFITLKKYYTATEEKLSNSNRLTILMNKLREFHYKFK